MNKRILLLNPAHFTRNKTSPNIGDLIISRAIERELHSIFGEDCQVFHLKTTNLQFQIMIPYCFIAQNTQLHTIIEL